MRTRKLVAASMATIAAGAMLLTGCNSDDKDAEASPTTSQEDKGAAKAQKVADKEAKQAEKETKDAAGTETFKRGMVEALGGNPDTDDLSGLCATGADASCVSIFSTYDSASKKITARLMETSSDNDKKELKEMVTPAANLAFASIEGLDFDKIAYEKWDGSSIETFYRK